MSTPSLAGAIVLTVLYVPLLVTFFAKSFTHPTYVHDLLTFFCLIRVAAFTIRVVLATDSQSWQETYGLVIVFEIFSSVGYFLLLYSAYTLVLDRTMLSDLRAANHPILRFTQDGRIFRLLLMVEVIVGIIAATLADTTTTKALRVTSVAISLFLTVLQALQTAILATSSVSAQSQYYIRGKDSLGIRYGNYILLIISLLLIIREIFSIATVNSSAAYNEHLSYPLNVLPEILVVILYLIPGLVPRRDEHREYVATHTTPQQDSIRDGRDLVGSDF